MDLYKEILVKALERHSAEVRFPDLKINAKEIVESSCYLAILEIRDIIRDETLDDPECFDKVEKIIQSLEWLGTDGGFRHD